MSDAPPQTGTQALLDDLNEPQRDAVLYGDGALLVLAGACSGKTRVITRRIAHLVQVRDVFPWRILAVTFTNKAAREMRERLANLLGPKAQDLVVATFHSASAMILRREAEHLGLSGEAGFTVGLLSGVADLIGEPVAEIADRMPLTPEVQAALTHGAGRLGEVLATVRAYESVDLGALGRAPIDSGELAQAYLAALGWSTRMLSTVDRAPLDKQ